MDKFGIFNLLNSFLNPSATNSDVANEQDKKENSTAPDLLNGLLNGLKNNSSSTPEQVKPIENNKIQPLQSQMLSTIKSHDQIIKRVQEHNTKKE